jgi:hypothetical protein
MDQLVKEISARTGISEQQAREAAQMVIGHLKGVLPEPIASQVDGFLGTGGSSSGGNLDIGGAMNSIGDMFGKK